MSSMAALLSSAELLARVGAWEMDLETRETRWTDGMYRIHGLEPGSGTGLGRLLDRVVPGDRERIAALMDAIVADPDGAGPVADEYRVLDADGSLRHVRFLGRVEGGSWVAASQDVTDERLAECELHARYGVSLALREWECFDAGVLDLLRRIGTALEYPMAALWLWNDGQSVLRCRTFWHMPGVDADPLDAAARRIAFPPDVGKPGLAWRTGEPTVTPDVAKDPGFRLREPALAAGVRSTMTVPANGPDGPLAVLTFYAREKRMPSGSLMRTLGGIGNELGRFLARRRADLGQRPLSDRELQVLTLAAEGLSGPRIAERLVVSPSTVKTHLEHIYKKLGVGDRAAAVAVAVRTGLVA